MNAPYFTSLSSQLEAKHGDLFDAHLFASLLVCLVAHERNLIVRTVEEDIGRVCNATSHVSPARRADDYISASHRTRVLLRCYPLFLGSPPIE